MQQRVLYLICKGKTEERNVKLDKRKAMGEPRQCVSVGRGSIICIGGSKAATACPSNKSMLV